MNLVEAALIVAGVTVVAIAGMLLVRRRAPGGSYFEDGDRAAGVFGVLATGFAVLLGFVVFLAFQSFDTSRSGASAEAQVVAEQFETAQLMPAAVRGRFSGELVCYARSVVHQEWPQMESGSLGDGFNPWGVAMFRTLRTTKPHSASEQIAFGKWLDQRTDRQDARNDRTHGAEGVIPTALWIVLFLSAVIIFLFMLFFGLHRGQRRILDLILGKQRFLPLLLREEESDERRPDEDCDDAGRVRPLVAVEERRLRGGGDLTRVLRVLLCDRVRAGE